MAEETSNETAAIPNPEEQQEQQKTTSSNTTNNTNNNNNNNSTSAIHLHHILRDGIFDHFLKQFGLNWAAFLTISILVVGLRYVLTYITDVVNGPDYGVDYNASYSSESYDSSTSSDEIDIDPMGLFMKFSMSVLYYVTRCLNDGAIIRGVAETYLLDGATTASHKPTAVVLIGTAAERLGTLVGSSLMVIATVTAGMFLLLFFLFMLSANGEIGPSFVIAFPVMVYVGLVTYYIQPAIIVEKTGVIASIQRSYRLAQNNLCEIFCVTLLLGFVEFFTLGIATGAATLGENAAQTILGDIVVFALTVFFSSVASIFKAVVYFKVRVSHEAYNLEALAAELGASGTTYVQMEEKQEQQQPSDTPAAIV